MEEEPRTTFVSPDLVNADAGSYNIMLDKIANSSAHFKHQQRGDPDLTVSEKREIAENLLVQNPSQFLRRFGHIVSADDLKYFDNMMNNDQISYQIDEVKRYQNRHLHQVMVKNRRYEALKKLLSEGQYFSEESMKIRDPFLYEKMVGKYLTDDQIRQRADVACSSLSGIFLSHVQAVQNNELYDRLKAIDTAEGGESSDDDTDNIEEFDTDEDEPPNNKKLKVPLTERETKNLYKEFQEIMEQRFLNGSDKDFNYDNVDNNSEYDSIEIRGRDEEDRYFNDEEPEEIQNCDNSNSMSCTVTDYTDIDYMTFPLDEH